jgi:hypothetical protein
VSEENLANGFRVAAGANAAQLIANLAWAETGIVLPDCEDTFLGLLRDLNADGFRGKGLGRGGVRGRNSWEKIFNVEPAVKSGLGDTGFVSGRINADSFGELGKLFFLCLLVAVAFGLGRVLVAFASRHK